MAGWPDATNTGVPDGVILTQSGSITITKDGTVIDALDVKGTINIQANNVTIQNSKVTSSDFAVIRIASGVTGTVIKNNDINGLNSGGQGIFGQGTFIGNDISGVGDGINVTGSHVLIQDNYIHDLGGPASSHYDGIQIDGGVSDIRIEHNTVVNHHDQTSAVMIDDFFGKTSNVVVNNNLLTGGGYTIYVTGLDGHGTDNVTVTNNHMGKGTWGYTYFAGANPVYTGNVNDGASLASQLGQQGNVEVTPPISSATEGADNLVGDSGNNTIDGKGGNDTINGMAGNDTLIGGLGKDTLMGGAGSDTFIYRSVAETGVTAATRDVITDFTVGTDKIDLAGLATSSGLKAGLTLLATDGAAFTGVAGQLTYTTEAGSNRTIIRGDVNGDGVEDFQIELTGIKKLSASDFVGVSASTGNPVTPPTSNVPNMTGTSGADRLTGDAKDNVIDGLAGNDIIDGGAGNDRIIGGAGYDTMTGGAGNDTFVFRNAAEIGDAPGARDIITDFTPGQDKIDLSAIDANTKLAGNQDFTFIAANDGSFTKTPGEIAWHTEAGRTIVQGDLDGDGIHDFEIELKGVMNLTANDFIGLTTSASKPSVPETSVPPVSGTLTKITGTSGADSLVGTNAHEYIDGGAGNDTINGGGGNDVIYGGLGRDVMTGGAGNDTFLFKSVAEMGSSGSTRDIITDFTRGQDKIDLSAIDANSRLAGDQAFTFLAGDNQSFTKKAGELAWHYEAAQNRTVVQGDINGDGIHDFEIQLTGHIQLTAGDFIL